MPKTPWVHQNWRHFQNSLTTKVFGQHAPIRWHLKTIARTRAERILLWLQNRESQHYGAKVRLPELFQRRDMAYFALTSRLIRMSTSPPKVYHDLLDASARVGALEQRLGYTFNDKMTCIEALKLNEVPLYYDGTIHSCGRNNRLALLGDRVLSLALCEIWFQTEHTTKDHNDMSAKTVSRVALAETGRKLRLNESILSFSKSPDSVNFSNAMAETFEAVLGAVYVDSKYSVLAVKNVLRSSGVADHQYLKTRDELHDAELSPIMSLDQTASNVHPGNPMRTPLEPRPKRTLQYEESEKPLSTTNGLKQASAPILLSTLVQKELKSLKAIASRQVLDRLQLFKRNVAHAALNEHAKLLKQGIEVRPFELYENIKKGIREGKNVEPETAEAATNVLVAPRTTDGPPPPFQSYRSIVEEVLTLQRIAQNIITPGKRGAARRRKRKVAAQRTLLEYSAILKEGMLTRPLDIFQQIRQKMGNGRYNKGKSERHAHELTVASIDKESALSRQERTAPTISPVRSPTVGVSGAQDQDATNLVTQTTTSKTAGETGGSKNDSLANGLTKLVNVTTYAKYTNLNISKASKHTMGMSQDHANFSESDVNVAGFLAFENDLSESSSPSKNSKSTNRQAETSGLTMSKTVQSTLLEPRTNYDKQKSRAGETPDPESTATSTDPFIASLDRRKGFYEAAQKLSIALADLSLQVTNATQGVRGRKLRSEIQELLPYANVEPTDGSRVNSASPHVSDQEPQVQNVADDASDAGKHLGHEQRHDNPTIPDTATPERQAGIVLETSSQAAVSHTSVEPAAADHSTSSSTEPTNPPASTLPIDPQTPNTLATTITYHTSKTPGVRQSRAHETSKQLSFRPLVSRGLRMQPKRRVFTQKDWEGMFTEKERRNMDENRRTRPKIGLRMSELCGEEARVFPGTRFVRKGD